MQMSPVSRRTSSVGSSIGWALQAARWVAVEEGRPDRDVPADARTPSAQVTSTCIDRGLERPRALAMPDAARLPLICRTDGRGWGVVVARTPEGLWVTRYASGEAHVTTLARHNACFAPAPATDSLPPPAHTTPRLRWLSGIACAPMLGNGWQNTGTATMVLLVLLLGIHLARWIGRGLLRGRWPLLPMRTEQNRFAHRAEPLVRHSLRPDTPHADFVPQPDGRDVARSN